MSTARILISRNYWQLSVDWSDAGDCVLVEGRHRITEHFWLPLTLTGAQFDRFVDTVGNAASIVHGFCGDRRRPAPPVFPAYEVVAACQGSCYWLEVSETCVTQHESSAVVVVYSIQTSVRPVLYLVGDEIEQYYADLRSVQKLPANSLAGLPSHPVEPTVSAVRDAPPPVRRRVIPSANGWRDE